MENFIVAGSADRIKQCSRFMSERFSSEKRKVAVFSSENLERITTLVQVRDGSFAKKPSACSTLRMSAIASGIEVSAYDDSWYDHTEWEDNLVRGAVRLAANFISDDATSRLTNELYAEAKKFFTCKFAVDDAKCIECGKGCDWGIDKKAPCQRACATNALSWTGERIRLDGNMCTNCGKCVKACGHAAIVCKE